MRRRDRFAGIVWLGTLGADDKTGRFALTAATKDSTGQALETLVHGFRLYVEIEMVGDVYGVQLYPKEDTDDPITPGIAISYKGPNLASILNTALLELSRLRNWEVPRTYTSRENVRWVA